jgi:KDO2-lipid IV(A) lauroyltransferase
MIRLGLFAAGAWLAEWLPAPLLYLLARAIGWLASYVPAPPRTRLERNLAVVLGTCPNDPRVRRLVHRVYQTHAVNYADLLRGPRFSREQAAARFRQAGDGWRPFWDALAAGHGLVLVTAHFGRFELLSHYLEHLGVPITLAVERLQPPALFDLLCRLRQRESLELVPHDTALRPLLRALARGRVAGFLADWDPSGHGVEVEFFGRPAPLPAGPAFIARRAGVPLFIGFAVPADDGPYHWGVMEPPIIVERTADADADVRQATQAMARTFERYIGRYPDQWVMFHQIWPAGLVECRTGAAPAACSRTAG